MLGSTNIKRVDFRAPSQGEDNCAAVARDLLQHLGPAFSVATPCAAPGAKRDSKSERGFDFSVREPCGCIVEIQVTRVPEETHYAEMAKATRDSTFVVDQREHSQLLAAIERALEAKTGVTPPEERSRRILAIDGLCPSLGLTFFLTGKRFSNTREVFGWRGAVVVIGNGNAVWLGCTEWPPCPIHGQPTETRAP